MLRTSIWNVWESRDPACEESGPIVTSLSVVTTPPGRYMAQFHDRSPLVLECSSALAWLQPGLQDDDLRAFLHASPDDKLEAYRVSTAVNKSRSKTEEVLLAIARQCRRREMNRSKCRNQSVRS